SLRALRAHPHGLDLGPLRRRLPGRLRTRDRRVHLAPALYLADVPRLLARLHRPPEPLVLIGRRHVRSNNSWLHNSPRLMKGRARCTLLVHPDDAATLGLTDGAGAVVTSRVGQVVVPVEVTDAVMPGVVSLPHGWGHGRAGVRLRVAAAHAGVSLNDLTDPALADPLTGTAALTGTPVTVVAANGTGPHDPPFEETFE
ncbi:MAG TPA: molybdopterin dinucleotide binding domain-containing protein, partial [Pseudonocardiaceae bacterium]